MRQFARNTAILFAAQVAISVISSATVLVMPIYLGDVGLGRFAFAQAAATILQTVAALGTSYYIVKTIAADRASVPEVVASNLLARVPLWALGSLIMLGMLLLRGLDREAMFVVAAMAAVTLVRLVGSVFSSALQGVEAIGAQSAAAVAGGAVSFATGLPLLILTRNPLLFCASLLAGAAVTLALNAELFRRGGHRLRMPSSADYRTLAVGALPFMAWAVAQGVYGQVNTVVIGLQGTEASVGWFAAAARLGSLVLFVPVVINVALLPALSRMYAGRQDAANEVLRKAVEVSVLMTLPLAAGVAVLAPRLLTFLHYPPVFQHSAPILVILCAAWSLTSLVMVLGTGLLSIGRQRQWAVGGIGLLVVFVALNAALVPLAQARLANAGIGAAVADVGGEALAVALALWLLPRGVLGWATAGYVARALLAASLMAVLVVALGGLWLPASVALGGCAYAILSLLLGTVSADDARLIWSAARPARGGAADTAGQTPSQQETSVAGPPAPPITRSAELGVQ